jgi:hypothetical protein
LEHPKTPKYTVKRRPKLHKRWALHVSTVALAVTGGFMPTNLTFQGQSVSFDVTAKVSAPLPLDPAVITSPQDQDRFSEPDITVSGTCPNDSYVKVFQNDQLAGISPCTGLEFSVATTLAPGANVLRAQVYNLTDDEGPASPSITVYYDAPQPPTPETPNTPNQPAQPGSPAKPDTTTSPTPGQTAGDGLTIILERYHYQRLKPNQPWQWNIAVRGGEKPYKVTIDWRDGNSQSLNRTDEDFFAINHTYTANGSYLPFITATDSAGSVASLQLYADVHSDPVTIPHTQAGMNPLLLWALYAGLALVVAQFWIWEVRAWHRRHKTKKGGSHA